MASGLLKLNDKVCKKVFIYTKLKKLLMWGSLGRIILYLYSKYILEKRFDVRGII